jgi:hypothetical protein
MTKQACHEQIMRIQCTLVSLECLANAAATGIVIDINGCSRTEQCAVEQLPQRMSMEMSDQQHHKLLNHSSSFVAGCYLFGMRSI